MQPKIGVGAKALTKHRCVGAHHPCITFSVPHKLSWHLPWKNTCGPNAYILKHTREASGCMHRESNATVYSGKPYMYTLNQEQVCLKLLHNLSKPAVTATKCWTQQWVCNTAWTSHATGTMNHHRRQQRQGGGGGWEVTKGLHGIRIKVWLR